MVKKDGDGQFERMPLVATGNASKFEGMLFGVSKGIQYYVDSDGVKSPTYSMKVVALPRSTSSSSTTCFRPTPDCLRRRSSTAATSRAARHRSPRERQADDGDAGRAAADRAGRHIRAEERVGRRPHGKFQDWRGRLLSRRARRPERRARVSVAEIHDRRDRRSAPDGLVRGPRRDVQANPVEEVFLQARAEDDFGVKHSTWFIR